GQELDRHIALQFCVSCSIDFSHSAFAEQSGDFVRAELLSDLDGHHFYGGIITVDIGANNREGRIASTGSGNSRLRPPYLLASGNVYPIANAAHEVAAAEIHWW